MNDAKILFIEDDLFIREIYEESLKGAGYSVTLAVDGQEGLDKLKQGGWDLVLLDLNLPKISGLELIKQAKASSTPLAKKYIILTNKSDLSGPDDEMVKLSDGVLLKVDYTPGEIVEKVKKLVAS